VKNLQRLLVQLIAMARAEEVPVEVRTSSQFELGDVVAKVAREHVERALAAGINLSFDNEAGGAVLVKGDAFLGGEIIGNLIDNAIRYNQLGGSVWLRVKPDGELQVIDDGPGIPSEHKSRVFERFYRIKRDAGLEGSGLGLSIVRALAERMGAKLSLSDRADGRGTCMCIQFALISMNHLESEGKKG
jgi:two-component system, OmpR family, sensor histidine kinase TctE